MNISDRNTGLYKALALLSQMEQLKSRLAAIDDEEGAAKDALQEARKEFQSLLLARERVPRVMELNDIINELQEKLYAIAREPSSIQNTLRKLGSDVEGFRARDWLWLKNWRIGREPGMGGPVDVEDEKQCEAWLHEVHVHAKAFLNDAMAQTYIAECEGKLTRRRSELATDRAANADADAYAAHLRADLAAEKAQRAQENREKLEAFDRQRVDFRAKLDREVAEAKIEAGHTADRRIAKKEMKRFAWLTQYWKKIARARDDKDFRKEWLEKVSVKNPKRAADLRKVFRSAGDSASALRGSEQFDFLRQRWERVVELLDADPGLTMEQAEEIADPEYREQRADTREREEARLAAHNEAQANE